jgi:hypothetical protein
LIAIVFDSANRRKATTPSLHYLQAGLFLWCRAKRAVFACDEKSRWSLDLEDSLILDHDVSPIRRDFPERINATAQPPDFNPIHYCMF